MTYCLRVCTVKYLPSFVCLLALECCCSFHLLATYISSFWPAWCAFTFFFWLFHFLFPITSWMFLFRLNAVIGSFLKISLRILITCKIFQFFLMVLVVFVRNQLHVITRGVLFDFFVWLYVYIFWDSGESGLFSHYMQGNYELKIFKLQYLLNPIYHYKTVNLKFSKMHKKAEFIDWTYVKIATFFQNIPKLWWPSYL